MPLQPAQNSGNIFQVGPLAAADLQGPGVPILIDDLLQMLRSGQPSKTTRKKMPLHEARAILLEHELERMVESHDVVKLALEAVEQNGIVFIDEIDKLEGKGGDSR